MEQRSFWERRPWTGALLFALLMIGVGWFLVIRIGEPKTEWRLRTVVPPPGTGLPGGPALGVFEGDPNQRPKIYVTVRVTSAAGEGLRGIEAVLVHRETGAVISRGVTPPISGKVDLPVNVQAAQALVSEELEVVVVDPAGPPLRAGVPRPKKGSTAVDFELSPRASIALRLVDRRGGAATGAAAVLATEPGAAALPLARGVPSVQGGVVVGGLPRGRLMRLEVRAPGREPGELLVFVPPLGAETIDHELVLGPESARVEGRIARDLAVRIEGRPFGRRPDLRLEPAPDGTFSFTLPPGEDLRLTFSPPDAGADGPVLVRTLARLAPGATWRVGPVAPAPLPELARGTVTDLQGNPRQDAVVTTDAYPTRDGASRPWVAWTAADAQGRFVLRGPPPAEGAALRLEARAGDLAGWSRDPVRPGSAGNEVEIGPLATLEGRLTGASAALRRGVALELYVEDGARPRRSVGPLPPDYTRFAMPALPPGRYALVVRRPLAPAERIGPIDLGPGDAGAPGETAGIRVGADHPWDETTCSLASGVAAPGARLTLETADPDEAPFRAEADVVGRVRFPRPKQGRLLWTARLGRNLAWGALDALGKTVVLRTLPALAIELEGTLPGEASHLEAVPAEAATLLPRSLVPTPRAISPGGAAFWEEIVPGAWRIRLHPGTGEEPRDLGVVRVPDEGVVSVHVLRLP